MVSTPSRAGFTRKFTLLLEYRPAFSIYYCHILISQSAQVLLDRGILHKVILHSRLSLQIQFYFLTMFLVGFLRGFPFFFFFLVYKKVSLHSMKDRRIFWNRQSRTTCLALIRLSKEHSAGYQRTLWIYLDMFSINENFNLFQLPIKNPSFLGLFWHLKIIKLIFKGKNLHFQSNTWNLINLKFGILQLVFFPFAYPKNLMKWPPAHQMRVCVSLLGKWRLHSVPLPTSLKF